MASKSIQSLVLLLVLGGPLIAPSVVRAAEFTEETERDYPLKTTGSLKILNQRGSISVVGWSMDRLRVKVRRHVEAANAEEAKKIFESLDLAFRDHGSDLELSVESGRGMDLMARLKERKTQRSTVDLEVRGPANLKLDLWGVQSQMKVHNWDASVSARASSGEMKFSGISAARGVVSAICPDCSFEFKDIHSNVRCVSEKGQISLENIVSNEVFAESMSGALHFSQVRGSQTYVTTSGKIEGRNSSGVLELRTRAGDVSLNGLSGSVSSHTDSGNLRMDVTEWTPKDQAALETDSGGVEIHLPYAFSSLVDFWSQEGKVDSEWTVRPIQVPAKERAEAVQGQRVRGVFGAPQSAGDSALFSKDADLRVLSRKGNIRIRRSGESS